MLRKWAPDPGEHVKKEKMEPYSDYDCTSRKVRKEKKYAALRFLYASRKRHFFPNIFSLGFSIYAYTPPVWRSKKKVCAGGCVCVFFFCMPPCLTWYHISAPE